MINFNSSNSNENWLRYLREKDLHEEALRNSNRDLAIQAYEEEKARIENEMKYNETILDFNRKKLKEFWENTYQKLGREILYEKIADYSEEKLEELDKAIQARQHQMIVECWDLDSKIKNAVEIIQPEVFGQPEISSFSEEAKHDYVAKTAHTVQLIDFLKYKRSVEGPKVIQKSSVNQTLQPKPTAENPANTLKYISRKDKVARLMAKSPVFSQPTNIGNEADRMIVKSPIQQRFAIPEEQPREIDEEQRFFAGSGLDSKNEEMPQQFSVKMEKLSPKDRLHEQFSISKSQQLAFHSNIHNDPHFEEKNFVKKNLDLYKRSPERLSPQKLAIHDTAEDSISQPGPPNIFDLSKEGFEGAEDLDESFMARLNEKFKDAYLQANSSKFSQKKNKKRQTSASGAAHVQEIPFVHDDTIRESHLISSLMSPYASDLAHINQRTGLFSNSKELLGREDGHPDQYESNLSGSPLKDSSKKYQETRRGRRDHEEQEIKRKKDSPSKKAIQMNPIFEQFESDFLLNRDQQLEEAERDIQMESEGHDQMDLEKGSGKKRNYDQKRPIMNVGETEDFILELTRLVTQGNGVIPSKCQGRLSELISSSQVAKQDKGVKSKVAESLGQKGSPKKTKLKLIDRNQIDDEVVNPQGVDEFNAISVHLDHICNNLTAKYLEFLRTRVSLDAIRIGWTALMALFADYDKQVPLINGKLNINDDTLSNYLGQPGRLRLQLQKLPSLLTQNPISQSFLNDFYVAFENFSEILSRGGSFGDLIHFFRYVYFIWRLIGVARASELIKVKNEEKSEPITRKKNEEYLFNAQKKREEQREGSVHRQHAREEEEAFGINFAEWAQNLDEIERENKIIKSNLHAEKVKEEHEEKKLRKIEEKKQAALELEFDRKQLEKVQQLEKENKEQEKKFIHDQNFRNAQYKKALREQKNEQRKQYEKEIFEQTLVQSEFRAQKIAEYKEQAKKEYHERNERLKERKETKAQHEKIDKQLQKEERIWEKAQKLLLRQRLLLQEREHLNQSAKLSHK